MRYPKHFFYEPVNQSMITLHTRMPFHSINQFDASRRGKKMLTSSRDKNEGTYHRGEGGGGSLLCDPGSELRPLLRGGIRTNKRCEDNRWDAQRQKKAKQSTDQIILIPAGQPICNFVVQRWSSTWTARFLLPTGTVLRLHSTEVTINTNAGNVATIDCLLFFVSFPPQGRMLISTTCR